MMDVADRHGMHIDPYRLGAEIGAPVVPLIASRARRPRHAERPHRARDRTTDGRRRRRAARHQADARTRDDARHACARTRAARRDPPSALRRGGAARRRRRRRGADRPRRSTRAYRGVRRSAQRRALSRHRRTVGTCASHDAGAPHRHRYPRRGVPASRARIPAVPRRDVSDVHVHDQRRQRVHRLLRSVRHGAVRRGAATDLCVDGSAGVAQHISRRRCRRRHSARLDVHSGDRVPVPVPVVPRRFGLHGSRRIHRRPVDAARRTARQIVRAADRRLRLQRACRDGNAHPRQRTRSRV